MNKTMMKEMKTVITEDLRMLMTKEMVGVILMTMNKDNEGSEDVFNQWIADHEKN